MPLNGSDEALELGSAEDRAWKLHARLPELYRESPELLGPLVDAAEDLLAHLREELERAEQSASSGRPLGLGHDGFGKAGEVSSFALSTTLSFSTAGGLALWLERETGSRPRVWNGLHAAQHPSGGLTFSRASCRSAVIAWEREQLATLPVSLRLPTESLPLGARIELVALGRLPETGAPRHGERFAGEILRVWQGSSAEDASRWT